MTSQHQDQNSTSKSKRRDDRHVQIADCIMALARVSHSNQKKGKGPIASFDDIKMSMIQHGYPNISDHKLLRVGYFEMSHLG